MLFPATPAMNAGMNTPPLTLYYDGLCPLCSREIAHYRKKVVGEAVHFVDITDPAFDAAGHGLDPRRIHQLMHMKVGDEVRVGLEAFIALWEAIPAYRWLGRLARVPVLHGMLGVGCHAFAVVRPWLPRRKRPLCSSAACDR